MQENNWPSLCNCRGQIDNAKFEQTREENCHPSSEFHFEFKPGLPEGGPLPCEEKGRETRQQWTTAPPTPTSFETFQKYLKADTIQPLPDAMLDFDILFKGSSEDLSFLPIYLSTPRSIRPFAVVRFRSLPPQNFPTAAAVLRPSHRPTSLRPFTRALRNDKSPLPPSPRRGPWP